MEKTTGTMELKSEIALNQPGSSAAANLHKSYSAKELAEVYMTSREDFLALSMGEATQNWNLNFIYSFLNYINDLKQIDLVIEWLTNMWDYEHQILQSYDTAVDTNLLADSTYFAKKLNIIREKIKERLDKERRVELLKAKMLEGFSCNTTSSNVSFQKPVTKSQSLDTTNNDGHLPQPLFHMADLPEDVRTLFTFEDDEIYSIFVTNMRDDTWLIVKDNKGKYLDRLRFVCRKFGIVRKDISREQFDKLLHCIIPDLGDIGNLISAMKKQTDSNNDSNLRYYDSPVYTYRAKCKELITVGLELEESLIPVLKKVNNKEWDIKSNPR